jgi:DNA (cytosine-5)-methyltransferase 1
MRFLSVCSGIEAASVAWNPLGWRAAWFSEIEAFPSAVLAHHYPDTPNRGDMTRFKDWPDAAIDLLCGGTPCQSFSNAGLRAGLDDPRGQLMLTFGAIAARYRPRWLVWENVPGVLSSGGGRDFGAFLGLLGHLGYGFAYRVLDAQFVRVDGYARAVPQRRQRVFVVGCLGDWRSAAAVLLERESLRGVPAPRREARARVAATLTRGAESSGRGGYAGRRQEDDVNIVAGTLDARTKSGGFPGTDGACSGHIVAHALTGEGFDASEDGTGRGTPLTVSYALNAKGGGGRLDGESETLIPTNGGVFDVAGTLDANHGNIRPEQAWTNRVVAFNARQDPINGPIDSDGSTSGILTGAAVRRLMPVECERLQGYPDGYTLIPWRGKPAEQCPDGPRYKALGNSWAVNCPRWIGMRIAMVDALRIEKAAA